MHVLCKGGDGGFGNAHFKSSTNQAPRHSTPGWPGEERWIWLRLKLIADAGLVGLPNAGKSTLLAAVTRAKPKIADYPFTTLHPQLGVVHVDEKEFVLADIPGLIEGAHEGAGLGTRFLGHVERCGVLIHLVDGTQEDVAAAYKTIRAELKSYSPVLAGTPFPCEDIDAAAAVLWAGFKGRYDPRPLVLHHHRRRAHDVPRLRAGYDRGRGAYYAKFLLRPECRRAYAAGWLSQVRAHLNREGLVRLFRELRSAAAYLRFRRKLLPLVALTLPALALYGTAALATAARAVLKPRPSGAAAEL